MGKGGEREVEREKRGRKGRRKWRKGGRDERRDTNDSEANIAIHTMCGDL